MKNNTNFPKPRRGYKLDAGDKLAIKKRRIEEAGKRRAGNKLNIYKQY